MDPHTLRDICRFKLEFTFSSVQLLSRVWLCDRWITVPQASLSITNCWSLPKPMSMESVMPSNHPLSSSVVPFSSSPQSFSESGFFSNESVLRIRWPKYWSFSFSISPSSEHPGLIPFRMGLVGSPWSPWDSQESSPTPQFKSINFSALSFLYSPTLTSIHDHRKNHSLD